MQSYLKTGVYKSSKLKKDFELVELSALDQADIVDIRQTDPNGIKPAALTCQRGVREWHDCTPDEVAKAVPFGELMNIAGAVIALSGTDELDEPKNFEADQAAALSLDSQLRSA